MANELHDHVWVIDTAGADNVTSETVLVRGIRFLGAVAGDEAVVENAAGQVVYQGRVSANLGVDDSGELHMRLQGGFSVPTLDTNGLLFIYGQLV